MLTFVTCVKHPENSDSYDEVWRLLNNTLYSVCSQQNKSFRVVVVCDKQLPLLHHDALINKYTEFVEVNFPSHSEKVLENFASFGNLTPPLNDANWWGIINEYKTAVELNPASYRLGIAILERFLGKKIVKILIKTKPQMQAWLNGIGNSHQKKEKDYFHIANVVLNMGSKLLIGILAAKKYNPDYVMFVDADDYVGKEISAYVNSHLGENGWIMAHGYRMAGKRIAPFYRWNSVCGTGNIIRYSLLDDLIGTKISVNSSQVEIFESVDSELLFTIGRHDRLRSYFIQKDMPLLEYPTRSVIHQVAHQESSEYARSKIRGERIERQLEAARRFGQITTISSTLIDYFNVLPDHSQKVFCLGFQKTGTTSVEWVLRDMGYQVSRAYKQSDVGFVEQLKEGDLSELKQVTNLFDAFQDIPWFKYYKEFDALYSGSKFILTTRETNSWWKSFNHYFKTENYPLFDFVYGTGNPIGKEQLLKERYIQHNQEVLEYFKERPEDLLVIDVGDEGVLQKITSFLGKKTSFRKMPHKNATLEVPSDLKIKKLKILLRVLMQVRLWSVLKYLTFPKSPIIVGGSQKSGGKLMLSILSCHPSIHPVRDMKLNYISHHPFLPDRTVKSSKNNLKDVGPVNQNALMYKIFRDQISLAAKRWCGAAPVSILQIDQILKHYGPNVRIINMVRDGRDVIVENDKVMMGRYAVSGEMWMHDIAAGMVYENHPQVLTIRYEDLIEKYAETVHKICEFIGEKDSSPFLDYPKEAAIITDRYWIGKWREPQFSSRINQFIQTRDAIDYLKHYGYIE